MGRYYTEQTINMLPPGIRLFWTSERASTFGYSITMIHRIVRITGRHA